MFFEASKKEKETATERKHGSSSGVVWHVIIFFLVIFWVFKFKGL